jgi:hypothetical protein
MHGIYCTFLTLHGSYVQTDTILGKVVSWIEPPLTDSFRYPSIFVQVAKEQAVDECRLSEAGLADNHESKVEASLHRLPVDLFRQCRKSNVVPVSLEQTGPTLTDAGNIYIQLNT